MKIIILLIIFVACSIPKMQPKKLELEKYCDNEKMKLPDSLREDGLVRVRDVRILENANSKCGRHAIDTAIYNERAAIQNSPDSWYENFHSGLKYFAAGVIIGFGASGR